MVLLGYVGLALLGLGTLVTAYLQASESDRREREWIRRLAASQRRNTPERENVS